MAKKRRLSIGTPCDNVWDELEPRDEGRFCPQCEKVVIDLRDKTARDAWRVIDQARGALCVRIRPDANGEAVFKRPPSPPASARLAAIAAGALLAACEPSAEPAPEPSPLVEVEPAPHEAQAASETPLVETPEPEAAEPEVAEPEVAEPEVAEPEVAERSVRPAPATAEHRAHPGEPHTARHTDRYDLMGDPWIEE